MQDSNAQHRNNNGNSTVNTNMNNVQSGSGGVVLMGGGTDVDDAFVWMGTQSAHTEAGAYRCSTSFALASSSLSLVEQRLS